MPNEQKAKQEEKSFSLFAKNIIKAKGKNILSQDKALSCLSKSDKFFKELTNLFNKLNLYKISPENFQTAIETLPESTDKNRLILCAEIYKSYISLMSQNNYKIPFVKTETKRINPNFAKNENIKSVLEFLQTVFEDKKTPSYNSVPCENLSYIEFSDIQSECDYVINTIKNSVNEQSLTYNDFAIFIDKTESRQKFADLLKAERIPVISSIYNENYENLKHKVNVYQKISTICQDLCIEEFNFENFKNLDKTANLNYISKSQKEICLEQLDEILKSLAEEIFSDNYTIDKISALQERSRKSLSETIFSAFNIISEKEREILALEIGAIKSFYAHYKENQYANAIETIIMRFFKLFEETKELKDSIAGKIKSLNELQNLYDNILKEKPDFDAFKEILEWLPQDTAKDKNAVRLSSINNNFKEEENYKYIFISGLTENNFPGNNPSYPFISEQTNSLLSQELKKFNQYFNTFLLTDEDYTKHRIRSIFEILCHAKENIIFTTRNYETKKSVQPSIIFKILKRNDSANFKKLTDEDETSANINPKHNFECIKISDAKEAPCVIDENDIIKLNTSAISAFQSCQKKYYFKNLLNLKETSSFSASYGSIIHAIFETMNRKYLEKYSKKTALALGEILFNAKNDTQKALDAGFNQIDIDLINATDNLALKEMEENFQNAMDDYELNGYFEHKPSKAVCEKEFHFSLETLPNVVFDGRIDAILTNENGETSVVDYKTGKDKTNSLSYAISENGVNFKTKTGKDPSNIEALQNSFDYQIPLYYLACQNSKELEEYKNKINNLGLLYIRPRNKHDGCNDDFVNAESIELYKEKIIQNLKETVIDKIRYEKEFKPSTGFGCEYCSYRFLCGEEDYE